jgi:hypothetical protein
MGSVIKPTLCCPEGKTTIHVKGIYYSCSPWLSKKGQVEGKVGRKAAHTWAACCHYWLQYGLPSGSAPLMDENWKPLWGSLAVTTSEGLQVVNTQLKSQTLRGVDLALPECWLSIRLVTVHDWSWLILLRWIIIIPIWQMRKLGLREIR